MLAEDWPFQWLLAFTPAVGSECVTWTFITSCLALAAAFVYCAKYEIEEEVALQLGMPLQQLQEIGYVCAVSWVWNAWATYILTTCFGTCTFHELMKVTREHPADIRERRACQAKRASSLAIAIAVVLLCFLPVLTTVSKFLGGLASSYIEKGVIGLWAICMIQGISLIVPMMYFVPAMSLDVISVLAAELGHTSETIDWEHMLCQHRRTSMLIYAVWDDFNVIFMGLSVAASVVSCVLLSLAKTICDELRYMQTSGYPVVSGIRINFDVLFLIFAFFVCAGIALAITVPPAFITSAFNDENPSSGSLFALAANFYSNEGRPRHEKLEHSRFMNYLVVSKSGIRIFGIVWDKPLLKTIGATAAPAAVTWVRYAFA